MPTTYDAWRQARLEILSGESEEESARAFVETIGPSLLQELSRGAARGVGHMIEGVGAAMRILGGEEAGKRALDLGKAIVEEFPRHPELIGNLVDNPGLLGDINWWAGGIGEAVPMLVGGGGVALGARTAGLGVRGASLVGGVTAGATEGLPLYNELVDEQGLGRGEATARSLLNAAAVTGLNAIPLARALTPAASGLRPALGKAVGTGLAEGITEFAEEPVEALLDPQGDIGESIKAGLTVAPIAAVTGAGIGLAGSIADQPAPTPEQMNAALTQGGPAAGMSIRGVNEPDASSNLDASTGVDGSIPAYSPTPLERALENDTETGWLVSDKEVKYEPIESLPTEVDTKIEGGVSLAELIGPDNQIIKDYPRLGTTNVRAMTEEERLLPEAKDGFELTSNDILLDSSRAPTEQGAALRQAVQDRIAFDEDLVGDDPGAEYKNRLRNPAPRAAYNFPNLTVNRDTVQDLGARKRQAHTEATTDLAIEPIRSESTKPTDEAINEQVEELAEQSAKRDAVRANPESAGSSPSKQFVEDAARGTPEPRPISGPPAGVVETPRGPVIGNKAAALDDPLLKRYGEWSDFSEATVLASELAKEVEMKRAPKVKTNTDVHNEFIATIENELGLQDMHNTLMKTNSVASINEQTIYKLMTFWNTAKNNYITRVREYKENPTEESEQKLAWARNSAAKARALIEDASKIAGRSLQLLKADAKFRQGELDAILSAGENPSALMEIDRRFRRATVLDIFIEIWSSFLLSNPVTWTVNLLSNQVTLWTIDAEMLLAAGLAASKGDRAAARAAMAYVGQGVLKNGWKGIQEGKNAFVTEQEFLDTKGKIDSERYRALSSQALNLNPRGRTGVAIDKHIGPTVRIPFRVLMAEDAYFKHMLYQKRLYYEGALKFAKQNPKLKGDAYRVAFEKFMKEEIDDIKKHPDIHRAAKQHAEYGTYNNDNGVVGQALSRVARHLPLVRLIFPFIRTPLNIIRFSMERTPIAFAMQKPRDDLLGRNGARAAHDAWARLSLGTSVLSTGVAMAAAGMITGAPPQDAEDARKWWVNNQPYSIRIGDTWINYGRIEPVGILLGLMADFVHLFDYMEADEADELAAVMVFSMSQNFINKTWLSGVANIMEAIMAPERKGQVYMERLLGSIMVPAGVAQLERIQDPYLRYSQGYMEHVRDRIPYFNGDIPLRYDIFGQPIRLSVEYIPSLVNLVNPFYIRQYKGDPVAQELIRLNVNVRQVDKKMGEYELTGAERMGWQKLNGRLIHQYMSTLVRSARWGTMSTLEQQDALVGARRAGQKMARQLFLARNPQVEIERRRAEIQKRFGVLNASSNP
jgi:hypothetical protein